MTRSDLEFLIDTALEAGNGIMSVYRSGDMDIISKPDDSPLTRADQLSHDFIERALNSRFPDIPILSEEGKSIMYEQRRGWNRMWLVDPLDGTKEFIKKRDEFTVNIALIENGLPVLGVIAAPALDKLYWASRDLGSWIRKGKNDIMISTNQAISKGVRIVGSRSHNTPEEETFYGGLNVIEKRSIGSSLKFCEVAEGHADIYYRHGPTWEWDTAAGQCIVECAGGSVSSKKSPMRYNKENLLNESFLVIGSKSLQLLV